MKRLTGIAKGKWETYLITPDQKILKTPIDLKLYIAKSGAVVDSNLVNFSLPKRTAKVDKMLNNKKSKQEVANDDSPISGSPQKAKTDGNEQNHTRFSTEGKDHKVVHSKLSTYLEFTENLLYKDKHFYQPEF